MRKLMALFLALVSTVTIASGAFRPADLRCEMLKDPLGIDTLQPRLSWILEDAAHSRGLVQSAYQVLVASRPGLLAAGKADLWDSGKVASDQSIHVRYLGKTLTSHQDCYWKVRLWDQSGRATRWSDPHRWTMGLLSPSDWKAKWIGLDGVEAKSQLADTQWIWYPDQNPAQAAPVGRRYFRRRVELPNDRTIRSALFLLAADNQGSLFINGEKAGESANFKSAAPLDVKSLLHSGPNVLAISANNVGSAPNPAGVTGLLKIDFTQGDPLIFITDAQWKSSNQEAANWLKADFADGAWVAAKVLGSVGMQPWGAVSIPSDRRLPARWVRKEFTLDKPLRRATAYFSGLGLSELYINGKKIGNEVLSPALSEYDKRVFYVTHEVAPQLQSGKNAIGVILGTGRYYAPRLDEPTATRTYGFPKLLLQLRLEFTDGSVTDLASDETWKLTTDGPIQANNEYDGEEYDARKELGPWSQPAYNDAQWGPAQLVAAPKAQLTAPMLDPIRVTGTIKPVAITQPKPGVYIFDMGQNMVGWCRLRVSGPAGTQISLRHAETLQADGTLYLANIRGAKVTDIYTLKGGGQEVYEPRFTYHGFRYVEVTSFPGQPMLSTLEGRVVNDDLENPGEFVCSQPTINQLYRNIHWGVRGNYRSIPTDCPQRDERQGWLGDRSAESKGESFLFQNGLLYAKWAQDMADAQKPNGSVSDVCPSYWPLYNDNVTWPSSIVIIPGALLDQYGDVDTIIRIYPAMVKWIDHMSGYITNNLMPRDTYGDWCVPPEDPKLIHSNDPRRKTAGPILGTCYFYHCLRLMARYAVLQGKTADAERFSQLSEKLKAGLNATYLKTDTGVYDNGAQTTAVLPLAFGMVPDEQRERVFNHLVDKITQETHSHIGTGLVGGQWLNRVLAEYGRPDIAYTFATNRTYPSWGYMLEKGATTIWELWNGDTADPAMNSGNHVMLVGDLVLWLNEYVAGIRSDANLPGFKHIIMAPTPVGDLLYVKASHRSPYGLISSAWERKGQVFRWHVIIPPNTTATLGIPSSGVDRLFESGKPVTQARGLQYLRMESGRAVFMAVSGAYEFECR